MCPAAAVALAFTLSFDPVEADKADRLAATLAPFPSAKAVEQYLDLVQQHKNWLSLLLNSFPSNRTYQSWNSEYSYCQQCWQCLLLARLPGLDDSFKLLAIDDLRKLLGAEAFTQGRMPPPVPVWRFWEGPPPLGTVPLPEPKPRVLEVVVGG